MKDMMSAVLTLAGLGLGFGLLLAWVSKKFHVEVDPRITKVTELLPGINCGACGLAGCSSLAEALIEQKTSLAACIACSAEGKKAIIEVLGLFGEQVAEKLAQIAVVHCNGGTRCADKFKYEGLSDCCVASQTMAGYKLCQYACVQEANCVTACPFGAIQMQAERLPKVDPELCRGCKKCVKGCPRNLFSMIDKKKKVYIKCSSQEKAALMMKKCKVGCIACGKCVKECPVSAIVITNNLAVIDYEKCVGCTKCVSVCPTKVIAVV